MRQCSDSAVLAKVFANQGESLTLRELALTGIGRHVKSAGHLVKELLTVLFDRRDNASLRAAIPSVLNAIDTTGKDVAGPFLSILSDKNEDPAVRLAMPPALARLEPQPVKLAGTLIVILKDEHESKPLRLAALEELERIKSIEVGRALDEAARTAADAEVRSRAKLAVSRRSGEVTEIVRKAPRRCLSSSRRLSPGAAIRCLPRSPRRSPRVPAPRTCQAAPPDTHATSSPGLSLAKRAQNGRPAIAGVSCV